jgi:hypothetical protein
LADPADLVREACTLLAGYMDVLERLVGESSSTQNASVGMSPRPADSPEPWDAPAGRALMDAHEGVRRLKARLLFEKNGHPGMRHGSSARNTEIVLDAIPKLAAGLDKDAEGAAVRILDRWINEARAIPAIDEARRWRTLPRPRVCPYCGCWFLRADMDARPVTVTCFTVGCQDRNGLCPVATMGTDAHGRPELAWADGLRELALDLEG